MSQVHANHQKQPLTSCVDSHQKNSIHQSCCIELRLHVHWTPPRMFGAFMQAQNRKEAFKNFFHHNQATTTKGQCSSVSHLVKGRHFCPTVSHRTRCKHLTRDMLHPCDVIHSSFITILMFSHEHLKILILRVRTQAAILFSVFQSELCHPFLHSSNCGPFKEKDVLLRKNSSVEL